MHTGVLGAALITLLMGGQGLSAQQPGRHSPRDSAAHAMMMKDMQQHMRMMDSANARLDSLVRRMNQATGNAKVSAMAQVINEMVAQRRAMQAHMSKMMRSHGPMMGGQMMRGMVSDPAGADTSEHGQHHP
jgi:hypothetical protein